MHARARYLLLAIAIGTSSFSVAQSNTFANRISTDNQTSGLPTLTGVIAGLDGAPLHDIRIEIRSLNSGMLAATCFSSANGSFEAHNLRPGSYEVLAVDGLNQTRENVSVDNGTANINLRMPVHLVGPTKGTVSVSELKTPEKARHLMEKAHNALAKSRLDEAQKYVESALAIAPDYPNALTTRGVMELASNQPQAAMDDLDHAVKTDPSYGPAYLALGAVFNRLGRYDEALRSLDRGSMYEPKSWQAALEASKAWLGKQDYQHALAQLNRAQMLGGEHQSGPIHLLRGYALMGEKEFEQASTELEAYLTAEPNGQLAGTVRAALAKIKTEMVQKQDSVPLPAVTGFFGSAQSPQ